MAASADSLRSRSLTSSTGPRSTTDGEPAARAATRRTQPCFIGTAGRLTDYRGSCAAHCRRGCRSLRERAAANAARQLRAPRERDRGRAPSMRRGDGARLRVARRARPARAGSARCCSPAPTPGRSSISTARSRSSSPRKTSARPRPKPIRCCPPTCSPSCARPRGARGGARRARIRRRRASTRYDAPDLLARRRGEAAPARAPLRAGPAPAQDRRRRANYRARRERGDAAPPSEPVLFLKAPSAVIGPDDEILLPAAARASTGRASSRS